MKISKNPKKLTLAILLLAACVLVQGFEATYAQVPVPLNNNTVAADTDSLKFFVADSETYDSNLYRLPSDVPVATVVSPNAKRQDEINSISLGMDGVWLYRAQEFDVDLRVDDNLFAHNSDLNNVSTNDKILWKWSLGSQLTGDADVDFNRTLATYGETLFLGKDSVDTKDYFADARYQFGPHWAAFGGVRETDSSHSAVAARYNNQNQETGNAGIEYSTSASTSFGLEYLFIDARFPDTFLFGADSFDRNFKENRELLLVQYALSSKTLINANAGFVERHYNTESFANFSGAVGRGSIQWQPTDKTQLVVAGWRDLQSFLSSQSDFFVVTGGSISPSWQATDKISLSLTATYQQMRFINSSVSVQTEGTRHDKLSSEQASISYTPIQALVFTFSVTNTQRDSTQDIFAYNDKLAFVSGNFKF
jgi:exopolysaccharide biosynthesis operon protein EpsL